MNARRLMPILLVALSALMCTGCSRLVYRVEEKRVPGDCTPIAASVRYTLAADHVGSQKITARLRKTYEYDQFSEVTYRERRKHWRYLNPFLFGGLYAMTEEDGYEFPTGEDGYDRDEILRDRKFYDRRYFCYMPYAPSIFLTSFLLPLLAYDEGWASSARFVRTLIVGDIQVMITSNTYATETITERKTALEVVAQAPVVLQLGELPPMQGCTDSNGDAIYHLPQEQLVAMQGMSLQYRVSVVVEGTPVVANGELTVE